MSVQIGNLTFDRVRYDRDGDVLYLHRADPKDAVDFDASPEGHALRFNAAGKLIGVTIVNARWLLEHEGKITITIPERLEVEAAALGEALTPLSPRQRLCRGHAKLLADDLAYARSLGFVRHRARHRRLR